MEIMMKDIEDVISSVLQKSERFKKEIQKNKHSEKPSELSNAEESEE